MPQQLSLVEEARRQIKGQTSSSKSNWKSVLQDGRIIRVEKVPPPPEQAQFDLKAIKTTDPRAKAQHKARCDMCRLWFEKSSVMYTTPNHRIEAVFKSWGYVRQGKRYTTASFLYANAHLCTFCAHMFDDAGSLGKPQAFALEQQHVAEVPRLLDRTNLEVGMRAYQSSVVDGLEADNAISPFEPEKLSKTRREVDPWWEIDLNEPVHVHSISLEIRGALKCHIDGVILLLDEPKGFVDPFLDSVSGRASASFSFSLPYRDTWTFEMVEWIAPSNSFTSAVRIQLRGVHDLTIKSFSLLRGNEAPTPAGHFAPDLRRSIMLDD